MREPKDDQRAGKKGALVRSLSVNFGANCQMSIGARSVSFWR